MTWILTSTGRAFDLANPQTSSVSSLDIAHALANICRFAGHTSVHYSVAQHSLMVCDIVAAAGHDAETQLQALLHDAAEAYLCDLPRPIKHYLRDLSPGGVSSYDDIDTTVWAAICEHFGILADLPACVEEADMIALATERRDLMPDHPADWKCLACVSALPERIAPMPPTYARTAYHDRLLQLMATTHRMRASA